MKKLLGLSIALLAAVALMVSAGFPEHTTGLKVGDKATDFKLKNVDGKYYSLGDIKDANGEKPKGYIITFTCNTCPWAIKYEDRLIELHNRMAPKGYPVVAIQPNDPNIKSGDSYENMQKRSESKEFPFLYLMDEKQEVFPAYGATRTPEVYLVDNTMTLRFTGSIDDNPHSAKAVKVNYVESAIEAIEAGKDPDPSLTKGPGCGIKKAR